MRRAVKNFFKSKYRSVFQLGQKFGLNILPHHFYSNIPDIKYLKENDFWLKPNNMRGIEMNSLDEQIQFIRTCCAVENPAEFSQKNIYEKAIAENGEDGGFGLVESDFLHWFIKFYKPKKIVQVGGGVSTSVILNASAEANHSINFTCIEPPIQLHISLIKKKRMKFCSL